MQSSLTQTAKEHTKGYVTESLRKSAKQVTQINSGEEYSFPVLIERWTHLVSFRTQQLSISSPMVLRRVFVGE